MQKEYSNKIIGRWLLIGVAMLIIQVILGGITRLTGSGLSIAEWKPILGAVPPLNEIDWQKAFDLYKEKTSQFKYLNSDFTLSQFKFIYFWEWLHREWARVLGFVFIFPFIYFLYKKWIDKKLLKKLIIIILLGVLIASLGWIMVASGLENDNMYVSHIKLALHFNVALITIAYTYWVALHCLVNPIHFFENKKLKNITAIIITLLLLQLIYGAFMAGLKAATFAPTWPLINGDIFPITLNKESWINHPINVHFVHRGIAYTLLVLITIWYFYAIKIKTSPVFNTYKMLPLVLVFIQIILGVFTVLTSTQLARNSFGTFEYLAQAHQIVAIFLWLSMIGSLFLMKRKA